MAFTEVSNAEDSKQPSTLVRWKLVYDLQFKAWQTFYEDLPKEAREKGFKMLTLYTASLAVVPYLSSHAIDLMIMMSNKGHTLMYYVVGVVWFATLIFSATAIVLVLNSIFKSQEFHFYNAPAIRGDAEKEENSDEFVYRSAIQNLERARAKSELTYVQVRGRLDRSIRSYYASVGFGFCLYFLILAFQFKTTHYMNQLTKEYEKEQLPDHDTIPVKKGGDVPPRPQAPSK
jgi:hypothetical protein